jgi:hypothetical protein
VRIQNIVYIARVCECTDRSHIGKHCKLFIKNPLSHSLEMALGSKPKHVAVMMFSLSFKRILYAIKVMLDSPGM